MFVPAEMIEAMLAHSRSEFPNEACGLLAADADGNLRMCYCLTNADRSPVSYTVAATEHFGALQHAERNGWELTGVFHSHTRSPAVPSETDRRLALEPDWIYLIVGIIESEEPEVRGYRIRHGEATEEPLSFE